MVDWLTIQTPRIAEFDLPVGQLVKIEPTGEMLTLCDLGHKVPSFDTSCRVRPVGAMIEISGNPSKWLQGHNLFGSDDVKRTTIKFMTEIEQKLGKRIFPENPLVYAQLHEIHLAQMVDLESEKNKSDFLMQLGNVAKTRHKKQFQYSGQTVYFGKGIEKGSKNSRLYFWRIYDKYKEIQAHKQKYLLDNWEIRNHVRAEVVLKRMWLMANNMEYVKTWNPSLVEKIYMEMLGKINVAEGNLMETLIPPPGMTTDDKKIWYPWVAGEDIRVLFPRRTFYNHRKRLMERYNVDINLPPYKTDNNILSFGWAKLRDQMAWMQKSNLNKYRKVA